ncbi:MAG: sodium:solute symporter [Muribaculaceae bacterium]|nr:sodium:solute symporter [Muribaculaceae bacterium]
MNQPITIALIIGAYFMLLLLVAHLSSRGATNKTYFTGNRNMPWPIVAMAMVTAPISGLTFISVPGMVVTKGYTYLQMCLGFIVGYLVIAWVLVPLFYKRNIISIYSFLEERFGTSTYKTGAWLFLISEILGIGVRFMVVCMVLQLLVFGPLHLPFILNVGITMSLIWLYTARGGVKSVVWSDTIKSLVLIASIVLCFYFISNALNLSGEELVTTITQHPMTHVFNFDDPMASSYFWKQFLTGVFLVVAMTGLDQDLMQRVLACKDAKGSRKNLAVSGSLQFVIITLFLVLGTLMIIYMERNGIPLPEKTDDIFATVAYHEDMPMIVSILFILGLVSAAYSSVGSALTSLTTSYTVDIMEGTKKYDEATLKKKRKKVHGSMALMMAGVIIVSYYLNHQDAITALFTLASYSYGPILGLFAFGIFSKRNPNPKWIPRICLLSPLACWIISKGFFYFFDYNTGYEIFLLNALFTLAGLYAASLSKKFITESAETKTL